MCQQQPLRCKPLKTDSLLYIRPMGFSRGMFIDTDHSSSTKHTQKLLSSALDRIFEAVAKLLHRYRDSHKIDIRDNAQIATSTSVLKALFRASQIRTELIAFPSIWTQCHQPAAHLILRMMNLVTIMRIVLFGREYCFCHGKGHRPMNDPPQPLDGSLVCKIGPCGLDHYSCS